jgi:uncharacterized protein (DUF2225 family)
MDNSLLTGLESMGLGALEGLDIYDTPADNSADVRQKKTKTEKVEMAEEDMVFDKSYTCPVCDSDFKSKAVRIGRIRALTPDLDLRPRYEGIDPLKYDILACPNCGYAGLIKSFPYLTSSQRNAVKENICSSYKKKPASEEHIYTYQDALERHKLALVNAIVKRGKASEKAYICLKTGWLLRGETEAFDENEEDYAVKKQENESAELQFLRNAYDGFLKARSSETYPICGMDESTLDYLLAALAIRLEEYDTAKKLLSTLITSRTANSRVKNKAHDLKDVLVEKLKERNANE